MAPNTIPASPTEPALPHGSPAVTDEAHANVRVPRQIVTMTLTQTSGGSSPSSTTSSGPTTAAFPVAVAIPALVGGMLIAFAGAGFWWYHVRKRERERKVRSHSFHCLSALTLQRRWEAKQRRQQRKRERANSAASRPSMSGSRAPILDEKTMPPVPELPKAYQASDGDGGASEKDTGFYFDPKDAAEYDTQPSIDEYEEVLAADPANHNAQPPPKPSRSAKRKTAAESAAAKEGGDPNERYRPTKPSPLALAKEQSGSGQQEMLQPNNYQRAASGEWGVALGSPDHDSSFNVSNGVRGDPYLQGASDTHRAPSGQYSSDPYASYHTGPAGSAGKKWGQGGGWV